MTEIGWKFTTWSTGAVRCNACGQPCESGHVRVDRPYPAKGDPVLCEACHLSIMAGVDPDPDAVTPEWEQRNREQRLREMLDGA